MKPLDFFEYYTTGEEEHFEQKGSNTSDFAGIKIKEDQASSNSDTSDFAGKSFSEESNGSEVNEGLIDVIFKTFKTNMKVSVSGNLVYFRWEWLANKTFLTLRVKKTTLDSFISWIKDIQNFVNDSSK